MAGVASWKIDQLAEYERSKNYAGGLKACERLLKKSPNDTGLLFQKARFLLTTGNSDESTRICQELCHHQPPIINEDLVCQIYITLAQNVVAQNNNDTIREVSKDMRELWSSIIEKKPQDSGKLYTTWIKAATEFERWEEIQQTAQKAQKAFKLDKKRHRYYYFLGITTAQLAAESLSATDGRSAKMIADVNLRRLQGSVQNTVSPPEKPGSECSIQSYDELRLLYNVYWLQDKTEDMYKLASDSVLGVNSAIGQGDTELAHQVTRMLREKGMWQELKDYMEMILFKSELEDEATADVNMWLNYVQSLAGLGEFESTLLDVIKEDVKEAQASRGRALARCSLLSKKLEHVELETKGSRRTEEIQSLRSQVCDACAGALRTTSQTWFEDVKSELEKISSEDRARLKGLVQDMSQFLSPKLGQTISLQLDYLWCRSEEDLTKIIKDGLGLVRGMTSEKLYSEEVFLLPIVGLMRLHIIARSQPHRPMTLLVLSLLLLEFMLARIPDSLKGTATLVSVGRYLGFESSWIVHWKTLGVKNVLVDPLSHLVVERLSISQPQRLPSPPSSGSTLVNPVDFLEWIVEEYKRSDTQLQGSLTHAVEAGHWNIIGDLNTSRDRLSRSITLRMAILERRRIQRINDESYDYKGSVQLRLKGFDEEEIMDNRNMIPLLDYEPSGDSASENFPATGPTPKAHYVSYLLMMDEADCVISEQKSKAFYLSSGMQWSFPWDKIEKHKKEFTASEYATLPVWQGISALVDTLEGGKKDPRTIKTHLTDLKEQTGIYKLQADGWTLGVVDDQLPLPDSSHIQTLYIDLELFKTCAKLIAYFRKKTKNDNSYTQLLKGIKDQLELLHGRNMVIVQGLVKKLEEFDLAERLSEDDIGSLFPEMLGGKYFKQKSKQYCKDAVHTLKSWLSSGEKLNARLARAL
ncbi:hypothetical protein EV356DRAFT_528590 [Viridothelium virens]|uniref:Uncharacterized protein n=1 Tax=Viridothelium virens TaxID=1048519 RepID=A0A6A6HMV4_VIRVR|nr:hypothetical protein EV356DRAFT_528590 [Viridothelium virens]